MECGPRGRRRGCDRLPFLLEQRDANFAQVAAASECARSGGDEMGWDGVGEMGTGDSHHIPQSTLAPRHSKASSSAA